MWLVLALLSWLSTFKPVKYTQKLQFILFIFLSWEKKKKIHYITCVMGKTLNISFEKCMLTRNNVVDHWLKLNITIIFNIVGIYH